MEERVKEADESMAVGPLAEKRIQWKMDTSKADVWVKSGMLPAHIKSGSAALAIMWFLRDRNLPDSMILQGGIYPVNGRMGMEAWMMAGLVYQQRKGTIETIASDNKIATVTGKRSDTNTEKTISFTIEEAVQAQLANKDTWKKYTKDMLYNRAVSRPCRQLWPDVLGGMYTPEELLHVTNGLAAQESAAEVTTTNRVKAALGVAPDETEPPTIEGEVLFPTEESPIAPEPPADDWKITQQQRKMLFAKAGALDIADEAVKDKIGELGFESTNDLTRDAFNGLLDWLASIEDERKEKQMGDDDPF